LDPPVVVLRGRSIGVAISKGNCSKLQDRISEMKAWTGTT
jgi:hypothetical protein